MRSVRERLVNFDEYNLKLNINEVTPLLDKCLNCSSPYCSSKMVLDDEIIGCPIGVEIPKIISFMKYGMYEEAYELLASKVVFPEIISRICSGYCETSCVNNKENMHTEIKDIFRTLSTYALQNNFEQHTIKEKKNKKISIIGSGISGLVCALNLVKEGYDVVVYEKNELPGGTLMYGTPNMRLDKDIVLSRINMLKALGVKFITNTEVTRVLAPSDVINDSDAVIVSTGVMPRDLDIENRRLKNVIFATDYLKKANKNVLDNGISNILENKNVLVIGCGKTASDVVATALREKAKMVAMIDYKNNPPIRRTNSWPKESDGLSIDYAMEEARFITRMDPRGYNQALVEIEGSKEVEAVKVVTVKWNDFVPVYQDKGMTFPMDYIIIAMGSIGAEKDILDKFKIDLKDGYINKSNHKNESNIFICGDALINNGISILAVEDALNCVKEVLSYLEA